MWNVTTNSVSGTNRKFAFLFTLYIVIHFPLSLLSIEYSTGMVNCYASVSKSCMSVCLSVESWIFTFILEVNSNIESEHGSCTWPLTRSNWKFYILQMHRVHIQLHNVHTCTMYILVPIPVDYLHICAAAVFLLASTWKTQVGVSLEFFRLISPSCQTNSSVWFYYGLTWFIVQCVSFWASHSFDIHMMED